MRLKLLTMALCGSLSMYSQNTLEVVGEASYSLADVSTLHFEDNDLVVNSDRYPMDDNLVLKFKEDPIASSFTESKVESVQVVNPVVQDLVLYAEINQEVEIYNVSGDLLFAVSLTKGKNKVLFPYPSGVYFVESSTSSQKVIKQ